MCLPRMDGPSVFGQLLDRDAGGFRLGPVDTKVPAGRRYLPGTMVLETTWGTRTGWVIVRDVLLIGPWHHEADRSHSHRRSPTDNDADHVLLRTMRCVNGFVEMHLDCEPVLDYGRQHVEWSYGDTGYNVGVGRAEGDDLAVTLTTDLRLGFEGARARARTSLRDGDTAFVALSWTEHEGPQTYDEAYHRLVYTADFWHEWLSHGDFPDHPWQGAPAAQRADAQGPVLRPDGRDLRGGHDVAARDAGRRAQLGLPLLLDPRLDVRAVGPLHARLRRGGQRLLLLHPRRRRRARTTSRSCTASAARRR